MKKLLFAAFLLPLTLTGCKKGSSDKDYQFTKETFQKKFNPHAVVFESNYQTVTDYGYTHFINEYDYGKVIVNGTQRYAYKENGGTVDKYTLDSFGYAVSVTTYNSMQEFYSYYFGEFYALFFLQYEDFTYDKTSQAYVCGRVAYDANHVILSGAIKGYKNNPIYIEFNIEGYGMYKTTMCRHGEIHVPCQIDL